MNQTSSSILMRNSVFAWIAAATALALLIPLIAMRFTAEVNWGVLDFIVMAALLFGAGSAFVVAARKTSRKYWLAIGLLLAVVFLAVWAELAVGIFPG